MSTVMPGTYVSGECEIWDGSYIGCGVKLMGKVLVGKNLIIQAFCHRRGLVEHKPRAGRRTIDHAHVRQFFLGKNSFLSTSISVISAIYIKDSALVGMGSVVVKNVPDGTVKRKSCEVRLVG